MSQKPQTTDHGIARTARRYDEIPYHSFPFPLLQPARIGAAARLYGYSPVNPSSARTLEIGCAAGGHIIPLAVRFPEARFLGVDVSGVQIAEGQERIARLGISNIELSARSVTDLSAEDGEFDYIICHGVFSWVSESVRQSILHQCSRLLAPAGVAAISFNVLPGWRMLQVIRDTAIVHTRRFQDPDEKALEMRAVFEALSRITNEQTSYGSIWRNEMKRLTAQPDYYLLHELLEDDNTPMTVTDFCTAAGHHGLNFLGDANFMSSVAENAGPERSALIHALGRGELLANEQYADIVGGRTFRNALLVRNHVRTDADPTAHLNRISDLHLLAPLSLELRQETPGSWSVVSESGVDVQLNDADIVAALTRLIERVPSSARIDDLMPPDSAGAMRARILEAFGKLVSLGLVDVSLSPLECPRRNVQRPRTWQLARSDVLANATHTATQRHSAYKLTDQTSFLLPLADGTRNLDDLASELLGFISAGGVTVHDEGLPVTDQNRIESIVRETVQRQVSEFARVGLLAGPSDGDG